MSESSKITVTLKGTGAYSDPWIVFHADTVAEVQDAVRSAEESGLFVVVGKAAEAYANHANVGAVLGAVPVGAPAAPQAPAYAAPAPAAPVAAAGPPGAGAPICPHGAKTYKTGTGAKGAWSAWMCPTPKGTPGQCKPEWIN